MRPCRGRNHRRQRGGQWFRCIAWQPGLIHQRHVTGSDRTAARHPAFRWANTVLANVKNSLLATHRAVAAKHLPRYLGAFAWRFNSRVVLKTIHERLAIPPRRPRQCPIASSNWLRLDGKRETGYRSHSDGPTSASLAEIVQNKARKDQSEPRNLSIYQFIRHLQSFGSGRHSRRSLMARRRPRVNQESLPRASLAGWRSGRFFRQGRDCWRGLTCRSRPPNRGREP